jgi:hypothetical protein
MNVPNARADIPNYTNYQPNEEIVRLRKRVNDLLRLGAATPETFAQTLMQIWQEGERRRQSCMSEAEDHLRKYHAMVAQAHGFAAQSSILYSVINGYATIEERRVLELAEQAKEKAEHPVEEVSAPITEEADSDATETVKKRGRPKKTTS